jgi:hypothetical protein
MVRDLCVIICENRGRESPVFQLKFPVPYRNRIPYSATVYCPVD